MIVRQGGELFEKCLESIKELVDHVVVVCTDPDNPQPDLDIAAKFGAITAHEPWQRNFSLHRNQSIALAPDDTDWIFIIDHDEELIVNSTTTIKQFRDWLKTGPVPNDPQIDAFLLGCLNVDDMGKEGDSHQQPRLFKAGSVQYVGAIHNEVAYKGKHALVNSIAIRHYGYTTVEKIRTNKVARTHEMLLEQLERVPANVHTLYYLCQNAGERGEYDEAVQWGEKYIKEKDKAGDLWNPTVYHSLARIYINRRDFDSALRVVTAGLQENPTNLDLAFSLSEIGEMMKKALLMADGCRRYLRAYDELLHHPETMGNRTLFTFTEEHLTYQFARLALACIGEGMIAVRELEKLADKYPHVAREVKDSLAQMGAGDVFHYQGSLIILPTDIGPAKKNGMHGMEVKFG